MIGGAIGAYALTELPGQTLKPFISAYLLVLGVLIVCDLHTTRPRDYAALTPSAQSISPSFRHFGHLDDFLPHRWLKPVAYHRRSHHPGGYRGAIRSDKQPEFLFVPPDQVSRVAAETGAIPYDIPGVELTHVGEGCSFDSFVAKYGLDNDAAIVTVAAIVRGADTDRHDLTPQSAGLLAISMGCET